MPKVSVIIPSFNCETYIAETIDSVLNQSVKDIELIVVDDGSTDRTQDIVISYGASVRLITQENARVCAARNRGIRDAQGEFICLMDHDDYWYPDKLERQLVEFAKRPDAGVVYSTFIRWNRDASGYFPATDSYDLTSYEDEINEDLSGWIYHQFLLDCWMLTSTAMFRKEVFERCGYFDVNLPYSEDWELWFRISQAYPMVQLRRPTTLYRQHSQQGNLVVRDVDYRTTLLIDTVKKWGLCSQDGRCVTRRRFLSHLATYHGGFAHGQLLAGNRNRAILSFLKAWATTPVNLKYLAYAGATLFGWKPKQ